VTANREERRVSFDTVAEIYADARPGYPQAMFDEIASRVPPPARVLEVGPGPGHATLDLARRGYEIVAVELGENLARVARRRLAEFPRVEVVQADFHRWAPEPGAFDMVFSASAFHWIDAAVGYPKAHDALRPDGLLALAWSHGVRGRGRSARFWDATEEMYARHAPGLAALKAGPGNAKQDARRDITASRLFAAVTKLSWHWSRDYDAQSYLGLIGTYSDHLTLPSRDREALFGALRGLVNDTFGGSVRRAFETVLYLAHAR
jgi:SAM-dependent methyltransferase